MLDRILWIHWTWIDFKYLRQCCLRPRTWWIARVRSWLLPPWLPFFTSISFRPFWKTVYNKQVVKTILWTNKIDVDPRPWSVEFWPGAEFYGRCVCCQNTTVAGFYYILDLRVHIRPIDITSHEPFPPRHSGMADKFFFVFFLQCRK